MILGKKYTSFWGYILKNFIDLYLPYLWSIYLWWGMKFFLYTGNEAVYKEELITNLYSGRSSFWFLLALLLIRILHGFFEYYRLEYHSIIFFLIFLIAVSYYLTVGDIPQVVDWLSYGIYYNLGYKACKGNWMKILKEKQKNSVIGAVFLILLGIGLWGETNCIYKKFFTSIGITILLYLGVIKLGKQFRIIEQIGKQSMVFYLISLFVTPVMRVLLLKLGFSAWLIHFSVGTIGTIAVGFLVIKLYENVAIFSGIEYLFYPWKKLKNMKILRN